MQLAISEAHQTSNQTQHVRKRKQAAADCAATRLVADRRPRSHERFWHDASPFLRQMGGAMADLPSDSALLYR